MKLFSIQLLLLLLLLLLGLSLTEAKKSAKEWNSFTLTKKLAEVEREEVEKMDRELGDGSESNSAELSTIFVDFGPKYSSKAERANLAAKWQLQLKSGGVTVSIFFAQEAPDQLIVNVRGLEDTRDVLRFLTTQDEVMRTVMNKQEYWNSAKYKAELDQVVAQRRAAKQQEEEEAALAAAEGRSEV